MKPGSTVSSFAEAKALETAPTQTFIRNFDRLKQEMLVMRYKGTLDVDKALKGHPSFFLPIIHFSVLVFSKPVAKYIQDKGFDLFAQNDFKFMASIFEILHMLFKYRPSFKIEQFFSQGLPDRKVAFVLDIDSLIKSKHAVLNKRSSSAKPKSVTFKEESFLGGGGTGEGKMFGTIDHTQEQHSSRQQHSKHHLEGSMTDPVPSDLIKSPHKHSQRPSSGHGKHKA